MPTSDDWTPYQREEIDRLGATALPPEQRRGERQCPVCGHVSVRHYFYEVDRLGRPLGMSYTWCAHCHRYASGSGAPRSDRYTFDDPYAGLDLRRRAELERQPGWYDRLDALWAEGKLPQRFVLR